MKFYYVHFMLRSSKSIPDSLYPIKATSALPVGKLWIVAWLYSRNAHGRRNAHIKFASGHSARVTEMKGYSLESGTITVQQSGAHSMLPAAGGSLYIGYSGNSAEWPTERKVFFFTKSSALMNIQTWEFVSWICLSKSKFLFYDWNLSSAGKKLHAGNLFFQRRA